MSTVIGQSILTHEDAEIADGLGTRETVGAFRRVRAYSDARDARFARQLASSVRWPVATTTQYFAHLGRTVSMPELSRQTGIELKTLYQRWHRGDREERLVRPVIARLRMERAR